MLKNRSALLGYIVLIVLLTAGAAHSLTGSNTVTTDDIVDRNVTNADLGTNSVTSDKVAPDTLTGSDINESTLANGYEVATSASQTLDHGSSVSFSVQCPAGKVAVGGGISANPYSRALLHESHPGTSDHRLWQLSVSNRDTAFTVTIVGYATCIFGH